ncbi:MAG: hypothetical protein KF764_13975 [Labilithrix sp.]|nr:hypothetical protein [Labilithrix sp.]
MARAADRPNAIIGRGGDGACFVATLPRPLAVVATLNTTSAQLAGGRGAPRLFFMLPKLVVAAVPESAGSKVIELGQWTGTTTTIKGEVPLPVTAPLAADAAFQHILGHRRSPAHSRGGHPARCALASGAPANDVGP